MCCVHIYGQIKQFSLSFIIIFIECNGLNNFWNVFENWWNRTATYPIQLNNKLIMFGIYYDNTFYKNVNYVILGVLETEYRLL